MLPEKFLERMRGTLGEEYEAFLACYEKERYQGLRINPLKAGDRDILLRTFDLTPVSWEPDGYYFTEAVQPGRHPYHEAGAYYIQEPSAMAAAPLLEVRPGERALDLCAAPGGKSAQIAGYLQGRGLLVSNEIHPARAKILSENMERMGVRNVCVTNEAPSRLAERFAGYFDKILVDAPCSGEGMFRKNEQACREWSPENVELCARRQDEILDCAAKMLRPGGRMVYSTCTFSILENEGSVDRFLKRHPDFAQLRSVRLWPHKVRGEGHFAAALERAGDAHSPGEVMALGGLEKGIAGKDREWEAWREFCRESLADDAWPAEDGKYLRFGDHLYLAPENLFSLKGLKALRPGLHLGTLKKGRFEPSHALAMTLSPEEARHICHLSANDDTVREYLRGQTFPCEGEKGWYLITVDGFSLGWGKSAGGIMKNHYPRGLRK